MDRTSSLAVNSESSVVPPMEEENTFVFTDQNGLVLLSEGPNILEGTLYTESLGGTPDCDDADNSIYPHAVDIPADGIDQDCDGTE